MNAKEWVGEICWLRLLSSIGTDPEKQFWGMSANGKSMHCTEGPVNLVPVGSCQFQPSLHMGRCMKAKGAKRP